MITIDGSRQPDTQKVRYLVEIDGDKIWLSGQNFRIMLFLAIGRISKVNGWIHNSELTAPGYAARYIHRLKKHIQITIPYWDGIQNDHGGYYRLKSEHVQIVTENCINFPDEDVKRALVAMGQKKVVDLE